MKISCFLCSTEYYAENAETPCPCCHMVQTVEGGDIKLYRGLYAASEQMREKRFNKARQMYLTLCREYPDSFYAFFGLAAAKYGVITDKDGSEYTPICLCADKECFTDNSAFRKACALASADGGNEGEQRSELLLDFGRLIEKDRAEITKIAEMIPPYDIFLSINYEPEEKNYDRTADRLYSRLTEQGRRVFFAPEIIPEADDRRAAPFVLKALESCEQMLIYISDRSDFGSFRLRNEVTRYTALIASGEKPADSIVVAYSGINTSDIPQQLSKFPRFEVRGGGKRFDPAPQADIGIVDDVSADNVATDDGSDLSDSVRDEGTAVYDASEEPAETEDAVTSEAQSSEAEDESALEDEYTKDEAVAESREAEGSYSYTAEETPLTVNELQRQETESEKKDDVSEDKTADLSGLYEADGGAVSDPDNVEFTGLLSDGTTDDAPAGSGVETKENKGSEHNISEFGVMFFGMFKDYVTKLKGAVYDLSRAFSEPSPDTVKNTESKSDAVEQNASDQPLNDSSEMAHSADARIDSDDHSEEKEQGATCEDGEQEDSESCGSAPNLEENIIEDDAAQTVNESDTLTLLSDDVKYEAENVEAEMPSASNDTAEPSDILNTEEKEPENAVAETDTTDKDLSDEVISQDTENNSAKHGVEKKAKKKRGIKGKILCAVIVLSVLIGSCIVSYMTGWIFADLTGIKFKPIDGGYAVSEYSGEKVSLTVPDRYHGKKVLSIESGAFNGSNLKKLNLPKYLEKCDEGALSGLSSLEELVLTGYICGGSVGVGARDEQDVKASFLGYLFGSEVYASSLPITQSSLNEEYTFYIPSSLKSVTVKGGNISYGFMSGFVTVEKITIKNSTRLMEAYAFTGCDRLQSVKLGNELICIGDFAFAKCSALSTVDGGKKLYVIGDNAFSECTMLGGFELSENVYTIGENAFYGCAALQNINFPEGLETLGDYSFGECTSLREVYLPNGVTGYPEGVFSNCSSLLMFSGGEGLDGFGDLFFIGCSSLISVNYPVTESFTKLGDHAFFGCKALSQFCTSPYLESIGESCYVQAAIGGELILPKSLKKIGDGAFRMCKNITAVSIPADCTIGVGTFTSCTGIKFVRIEADHIPESAFMTCEGLERLELVGNNIKVGARAFCGCSALVDISGAENIDVAGDEAFYFCTALETIDLENASEICYGALRSCLSLKNVILSGNLTKIGSYAFGGCNSIAVLSIPSSVTYVGELCFERWNPSQTLNMEKGISTINWHKDWMANCRAQAIY